MSRNSEMEQRIISAIREEDGYIAYTDPEALIELVRPQINKKAGRLKQRHKEKIENRILAIGYGTFFLFIILPLFNCFFNGPSEAVKYILAGAGAFSLLLLCCLPLLVKFKDNILERRGC